jgi:hypothetical protein
MLHACVKRFDVMCVRGNILGWDGKVNEAIGRIRLTAAATIKRILLDYLA